MHTHRMDSVSAGATAASQMREILTLRIYSFGLLASLLLIATGCRSLRPSDGEGLFAATDLLNTDNIRGPLERALSSEEDALTRGEKFSDEAMRRVEVARKYFDANRHREAIATYKKIANDYPETSIGEEAWFRMGESHFALKEYPRATDAYDKLFADYPSTRYVADASEHLFHIAKMWLDITDPVVKTSIKTVSSEREEAGDVASTEKKGRSPSERFGLIPNFFDSSRPMFDTSGRARNALKAIWLNDPTGPLADDALMLTATYYLQRGNHVEADRYFEILREEYPNSPHLEEAFVLGAHVKQVAYQGPYYDNTTLIAAEDLGKKTLMMFPNSEDRPQIKKDLNRIYLLRAQDAWSQVELWKRKGNPRSVAISAMQVINEYPDTRFADMARKEILSVDPKLVADLPQMNEFIAAVRDGSGSPNGSTVSAPNPQPGSVSPAGPPGI